MSSPICTSAVFSLEYDSLLLGWEGGRFGVGCSSHSSSLGCAIAG